MKPRSREPGNKNIIGAKIVEIREAKGMKQKDLLSKMQILGTDMSATSLSQLEGQYRAAKDTEILAVSEALGVEITELLNYDRKY